MKKVTLEVTIQIHDSENEETLSDLVSQSLTDDGFDVIKVEVKKS